MTYKEIRINCAPSELDSLIEALTAAGQADLQIDDPRELEVFEGDNTGYLWNYVDEELMEKRESAGVTFYLREEDQLSDRVSVVLRDFEYTVKNIDDGIWMNNLQGYFVPTRYGKHVIAKPVWSEYHPEVGDIVVDIDPGQAFGTGSSPTTALALGLLEKYMEPGKAVLDIGCGTGILGILASKMGATKVLCTDIDDLAVECTETNICLNGVQDRVSAEKRDLVKDVNFTADIVAANLTVDILERLFASFAHVLSDNCILIASGIIKEKERDGIEAAEKAGFRVVEVVRDGEWVAFAAGK